MSGQKELLGRLIDVVEDWLTAKGFAGEYEAFIVGDDYDFLAESFSKILFEEDEEKESESLSWAEREVKIACKRENPDRKEGEFDYGCACYESALKAYKSLANDGHSGFSIGLTQQILNRLIDHKPLTPIEDTDDIWNEVRTLSGFKKGKEYQCKRMSSLFKTVYDDGNVSYTDVDRVRGFDINNPNCCFSNGFITQLVNELYPITMPYYPGESIKVYREDFLVDPKNGDYDTIGILYLIDPQGNRVEVQRYFKESGDSFEEIDVYEYLERKERRVR